MGNQVNELLGDAGANVLTQNCAHEIGQFIVRVLWKEHLALAGAEPGLVDVERAANEGDEKRLRLCASQLNIRNSAASQTKLLPELILREL